MSSQTRLSLYSLLKAQSHAVFLRIELPKMGVGKTNRIVTMVIIIVTEL